MNPPPLHHGVRQIFVSGNPQQRARGLLTLMCILSALYLLRHFIPALLWGAIFAIAFWPLYERMEKRFAHPAVCAACFSVMIALLVLVPLCWLGLQTLEEARTVLLWLTQIQTDGLPVPGWLPKIPVLGQHLQHWWGRHLTDPQEIHEMLQSFRVGHGMQITRVLGIQALHRSIQFAFALLTLFFLLKDGPRISQKLLIGSRQLLGRHGERVAAQVVGSIHGTLAGLILVALGEGAIMGVVYLCAGTPQPILFAFLTAIAAMVPMAGSVAVALTAMLIWAKGHMAAGLITLLIGILVLFIADHFIRPALIGGSTKLPFLWVLLGILGGVESWGLLGLFLGPAIMAALYLLWNLWTQPRRRDHKPRYLRF